MDGITEQFIVKNPLMTLFIIGVLVLTIRLMYILLSKLIMQPFNNLANAIVALTTTLDKFQAKTEKKQEETDKDIGSLLDRMQRQETKCNTIRLYCPHTSAHSQADMSNYAD